MFGSRDTGRAHYIVLDGQQRLTAIYYAFFQPDEPLPGRANPFFYWVDVRRFLDEEDDEAFGYDRRTRRWRELLQDRERQFAEHVFPLSVLGAGGFDLFDWIRGHEGFWQRRADELAGEGREAEAVEAARFADGAKIFGEHVRELTGEYQISYIELDRDTEVEKVCDISTQINSRGVRLDTFDLINALLKPKGLQLKLMWRQAAPRLEFVETDKMNVYVLQVMSLRLQNYCSPKYLYFLLPRQEKPVRREDGGLDKVVLVRSGEDFAARWDRAVANLESSTNVLRNAGEYGAVKSAFLPYASILPVFTAARAAIQELPPAERLGAQRKLRKWYWASVFTNRYSGSVESTSARDFIDLKAWFADDAAEPAVIQEFASRFREIDFRNEVRRGTSIYNGIFNLLILKGARDWISGEIPPYEDIDDHHIVPASWTPGGDSDLPVHTVLNRTPMTSATNRAVIRERLPNQYLPELMERAGEKHVRAILEAHLISPRALDIVLRTPFTVDDFQAFVDERRATIVAAIEDLLIKERLDLAPQLREIDARIEQVEIALRDLLVNRLGDDPAAIPPHIWPNVEKRIQTAVRKSPFVKEEELTQLGKQLEYFDLRELQQTIASKATWDRFAPICATKEALEVKFNQLAELRNGIRHSRTVDEVTRKEGEAAILWFDQCLRRTGREGYHARFDRS